MNVEILEKIERDLGGRRDVDTDLCVWRHGMELLREVGTGKTYRVIV
jgi:hypothetical protein